MKNKHWAKHSIEKAGLSKVDVAKACGCSYNHFSNVLNGIFNSSPKLEEKISEVLSLFNTEERTKRAYAPPVSFTKTILPTFCRLPIGRIVVDPQIVKEPAPETRERILQYSEKVRDLMDRLEEHKSIPPIVVLQIDDRPVHYLLVGRASLQAAKNTLLAGKVEAYLYGVSEDDLSYFVDSETGLSPADLSANSEDSGADEAVKTELN